MQLRSYQFGAVEGILSRYSAGDQRTLCVLPTGGGKTVVFASVADMFVKRSRVMIIAHRDELIRQAADKIERVTGIRPAIEKAEEFSPEGSMHGPPKIVVSSVQTLVSGKGDKKRMLRFNPSDFGLIVADEAHHATARTWSNVLSYFAGAGAKILGVTATPDRADGVAMGQEFQSVAFEYTLPQIIDDGYLVPIRQHTVFIEGLDFSKVRTTAGDLNQGDLEAAMLFEEPLHGVAHATVEVACGLENGALARLRDAEKREEQIAELLAGKHVRKTLIFCASVAHAERMAEIINRWIGESAEVLHGGLTKQLRSERLADFARGRIRFLCNCMVCTEGFDEPSIELVVMARPTKSRSLFTQMAGRGTRPLDAIAARLGELESPGERLALIQSSAKPFVEILDFVGNSGRHKLVSTVDILGDDFTEEEREEARRLTQEEAVEVKAALVESRELLEKKRREAEEAKRLREIEAQMHREQEAARRASLVGTTRYEVTSVNEFQPATLEGYDPRHLTILEKFKVPREDILKMSPVKAKQMSRELIRRRKLGLCTFKQGKFLLRNGVAREIIKEMTFQEASDRISEMSRHWKKKAV